MPLLVAGPRCTPSSASSLFFLAAAASSTSSPNSCFLHHHPRRGGQQHPPPPSLMRRRNFLSDAGGSWEETWKKGVTPWDTQSAAPPLVNLLQQSPSPLAPPVPGVSRALVPGAGSGYECLALAEAGWDVLGVDLAATAVAKAEALRDERAKAHGLGRGKLAYVAADFFALNEAQTFDLIFDYTFLCALPPDLRPRWAAKMKALLTPQTGQLVTLIFPVKDNTKPLTALDLTDGPPFEVSCALYTHLLVGEGGDSKAKQMECVALQGPLADSILPRQGREWLGRWRLPG